MRVVAFGQEDGRAKVHRAAPKGREQLALNLDVLQPLGVRRNFDGRDQFRKAQLDVVARGGIEVHHLVLAIQISRRPVELLPLPLVVVGPNEMTVRAMKICIDI